MKLRIKFADKIVGFFILLSLLGLATVLILLGMNQRWFRKNYHFRTEFISGSGLKAGMAINLKGFEVGQLDKVDLDPVTRRVKADFHIYDTYRYLVLPDSVIELASSPIGLGSSLIFHPANVSEPPLPPLEEHTFIPSTDSKEGIDLVRKGLVDRSGGEDSIGALLADVGPIVEQIKSIVPSVQALLLLVEEGLKGHTRENEIGAILVSIENILNGKNEGPIGKSLDNVAQVAEVTLNVSKDIEQIALSLKNTINSVEKLAKNVENPTGLVPRLLDAKGSIKTLLDDNNSLYNELLTTITSFEGIVTKLNSFVKFLNNTQPQISGLLDETNKTLGNAQDVMEGLKNNPFLRGGIPEKKEQPTTIQGFRGDEF